MCNKGEKLVYLSGKVAVTVSFGTRDGSSDASHARVSTKRDGTTSSQR